MFSSSILAVSDVEFKSLINNIHNKEFAPVEKFLESNRSRLSRDPEYYVVLLNYVLTKGRDSRVVIGKGPARDKEFELRDKDSGEPIGFLGERSFYNTELILDGINRTRSALKHFNSRLDIHFGIVHAAESIKKWDIVADQIVDMLKTSRKIDNKWIWGPINSMEGDPREFMIQNILPRSYNLFRQETPETDKALVKISRAMIEYYPDIIYGYANLGVYYLATKKYNLAEKYFRKALEIDPNDKIVLGNMEKLKSARAKNQ